MFQEAGRPLVRPSRWPSNMDPVYVVVKRRSTTYCAPFLGQAQDVDIWPNVLSNALFTDEPSIVQLAPGPAFPPCSRPPGRCPRLPSFSASSACCMNSFASLYAFFRSLLSGPKSTPFRSARAVSIDRRGPPWRRRSCPRFGRAQLRRRRRRTAARAPAGCRRLGSPPWASARGSGFGAPAARSSRTPAAASGGVTLGVLWQLAHRLQAVGSGPGSTTRGGGGGTTSAGRSAGLPSPGRRRSPPAPRQRTTSESRYHIGSMSSFTPVEIRVGTLCRVPGRRLHLDLSVVQLDDAVDHREADAAALLLGREIEVENLLQVLRRDADARVFDVNLHPAARGGARQVIAACRRRASPGRR